MPQLIFNFSWFIDLIDILIVAFVIYWLMLLVKGTRAERMLWGLAIIVLVYFISQRMELFTLHWILSNFLSSIVIIVIVVFQRDIRRALVQVGKTSFFGRGEISKEDIFEELTKATFQMSEKKIGALIVLEKDVGLGDYLDTGIEVDAKVSSEMLLSIFNPSSPAHDGAAIIRKARISRVGCFLPLTRDQEISKSLGTRHRAALGLAEETDAVIIVVSEEKGEVSLVADGDVYRDMDATALQKKLKDIFWGAMTRPAAEGDAAGRKKTKEDFGQKFFFKNTSLKIMAFAFAISLWFLVVGEKKTEVGFLIPLEFRNLPKDMIIVGEPVRDVEVRLLASKKAMANLSPSQLTASIDLSTARPGINNRRVVNATDIKTPKGVEIIKVNPSSILVHLEAIVSKLVPVKVKTSGNSAPGFSIKSISVEPGSVVLFGTQAQLKDIHEIYATPFDITGIETDKTKMLSLQLSDTELKKAEPDVVKVKVSVKRLP